MISISVSSRLIEIGIECIQLWWDGIQICSSWFSHATHFAEQRCFRVCVGISFACRADSEKSNFQKINYEWNYLIDCVGTDTLWAMSECRETNIFAGIAQNSLLKMKMHKHKRHDYFTIAETYGLDIFNNGGASKTPPLSVACCEKFDNIADVSVVAKKKTNWVCRRQ